MAETETRARLSERKGKLEGEIVRLQGLLDGLDRDWRRLPWLLAPLLAAPGFFYFGGGLPGLLYTLAVFSLFVTGGYLVKVRKDETRNDLREVNFELRVVNKRLAED